MQLRALDGFSVALTRGLLEAGELNIFAALAKTMYVSIRACIIIFVAAFSTNRTHEASST